ncbi:MAG: hypothetical protein HY079_03570 [Elusimicrobia bacterium]|nr:hypothetical protein [Elusimicrobiota bacterium]
MTAALLAVLLALPLRAAAPGAAALPFECPTPPGWSSAVEDSALRLTGAADRDGLASMILVRYYPAGDQGFADADAYVARQTGAPLFKVPGEERGPAVAATVAGRKARRVVQTRFARWPDHAPDSKRVRRRVEHVVVPAAQGFYVLLDDAPASMAAANRKAFAAVVAGFKPKL